MATGKKAKLDFPAGTTAEAPSATSIDHLLNALNDLRRLKRNWNGYGADPIDSDCIDAARDFVCHHRQSILRDPAVVPMTKGRLQLEWNDGDRSLEIEFETPRRIHLLKWDPAHAVEEEGVLAAAEHAEPSEILHWYFAER